MIENDTPPEPEKKPDLTAEERMQYSVLPCGYAWPASRLNGHDMHRLSQIRDATRKPITRLLQDAIEMLYFATEEERAAVTRRQAEARERLRTKLGTKTDTTIQSPAIDRDNIADMNTESVTTQPEWAGSIEQPLRRNLQNHSTADMVSSDELNVDADT